MTQALVDDYLERLHRAAASLPPERRGELVEEIREHIETARAEGQASTEAELRDLLDRLGDPEEIVAAAREEGDPLLAPPPPSAPAVVYRRPGIGLEIAAAVLMTVGSIVPVIGWAVGAILAWSARRWTVGEKLLATLVVPGGPFLALYLASRATQTCMTSTSVDSTGVQSEPITQCTGVAFPPYVGIPLLILWLVLPFVVAGLLLTRARRRADAEPPVAVPASRVAPRWGGLEIAAVVLLIAGIVIPVVGPLAGLICAWASSAWTTAEKWVATVIALMGAVVPLAILLIARSS
jgi:uncharacterized membrane protein